MWEHEGSCSWCRAIPGFVLHWGCTDPAPDQMELCRTYFALAMANCSGTLFSLPLLLEDVMACFSMGFAVWEFLRESLTWGKG